MNMYSIDKRVRHEATEQANGKVVVQGHTRRVKGPVAGCVGRLGGWRH
jgi:hypothetical protein